VCSDGIEAVRKSLSKQVDLIILNVTLPRMNGYQCSRVLKQDPLMKSVPVIHIGSSGSPLDRYWSKVCQGDDYLQTPVTGVQLERTLQGLMNRTRPRRNLMSHISLIPDLEDQAILMLATSLLEQDLLRATILNEINMIDTWEVPTIDLVTSLIAIIHSLYPFQGWAALMISASHSELYMCGNGKDEQNRFDETARPILEHLRHQHGMYLKAEEITPIVLDSPVAKTPVDESGEIFIHTKENDPIHSALLLENVNVGDLNKEEQQVLLLALDLVHGALEKKIFARSSQEMSVIDVATEGYSMTFFMEVLARETANARRNKYAITLFTIIISNFDEIMKDFSTENQLGLIRIIQKAILRTMRKTDIIARWKQSGFALLLTHTTLEKAQVPVARVKKNILDDISTQMPSVGQLLPNTGICEFNPERDLTPETFFANAIPKKEFRKREESNPHPVDAASGAGQMEEENG